MKRVVINIRASKNISGLVKGLEISSAGLMKFFLNVEPCGCQVTLYRNTLTLFKFDFQGIVETSAFNQSHVNL